MVERQPGHRVAARSPLVLLLRIVSIGEALTGAALALHPPLVSRLLFGTEPAGAGDALARIAGIAMVSLGVSWWPSGSGTTGRQTMNGVLIYNAAVTVCLVGVALDGELRGVLLWPVCIAHLIVAFALVRLRAFRD